MKKHYIIYKITNLTNGMFYTGAHATHDLDDGYMGSGVEIIKAIANEGEQNFKREILETFDTQEAMYAKEAEIVSDDYLKNPKVYNLVRGGSGGWDGINTSPVIAEKRKEKYKEIGHQQGNKNSQFGTKWITNGTEEKKIPTQDDIPSGWRKGRFNTPEFMEKMTKLKQDESRKLYGEKNPVYGKSPITNGIDNKRLKKDDPIPEGWWIGQTNKKKVLA